jgi:hypothetical protein
MQLSVEYHVKHTKEKVVEQLCDGRNGPVPQEGKMPPVEGGHQTGDQQPVWKTPP